MPKLPKYTWESCLSDIFVLSSIGKAWEKNKRHNSYKTGGQTLYGSHLKFILPTSSLRYHLELVSKELNHLVAILHVYAGGLIFLGPHFFK
jgi:hypothetical protein